MLKELWEGIEAIKSIASSFRELVRIERIEHAATGFKIHQIIGGNMQSDVKGIVKGATGKFSATTTPVGGLLQPGNIPKWSANDTNLILVPSTDGMSLEVSTVANDPGTSFDLVLAGINSAGVPISSTVNVPLTATVVQPATGFDIKQVS